jgi:hypothetical protein
MDALLKRMIDIGYKTLAKRLHPDAGGTHQDMALLNRAKDELLAYWTAARERRRGRYRSGYRYPTQFRWRRNMPKETRAEYALAQRLYRLHAGMVARIALRGL